MILPLLPVLLAGAPVVSPPWATSGIDPAIHAQGRALLSQLVAIPTVADRPQDMRHLTRLLTSEFAKAGITNVVIKDYDKTQAMIARWPAARPSGKKPILLMAHMDVVEAKASDWQNPPFEMREKDGYYLGRGTDDCKGPIAGVLLALQQLHRAGFQPTRDIIVLFTGDEETNSRGARFAASEWRPLIDAEFALNSDVGGGEVYRDGRIDQWNMQVAEKVYSDFRLTTTDRGGHSSVPRPDNAIYALADALKRVETHRFEPMMNEATKAYLERVSQKDGGFYGELAKKWLSDPTDRESADLIEANEPGRTRTRCVATMISGGVAANALPQRAEANVNCRVFPGVSIAEVGKELKALVGNEVAVEVVNQGSEAPASPVRADVMEAYRDAVGARFGKVEILPTMSRSASDGAAIRAAGIPVYGVNGAWSYVGEETRIHATDERTPIDSFDAQVPFWESMLRRLAG